MIGFLKNFIDCILNSSNKSSFTNYMIIIPKIFVTTFKSKLSTTLTIEKQMTIIKNKAQESGYIIKDSGIDWIIVKPRLLSHFSYHPIAMVWNSKIKLKKSGKYDISYNVFHPIVPLSLFIFLIVSLVNTLFIYTNTLLIFIPMMLFYLSYIALTHNDIFKRITKHINLN